MDTTFAGGLLQLRLFLESISSILDDSFKLLIFFLSYPGKLSVVNSESLHIYLTFIVDVVVLQEVRCWTDAVWVFAAGYIGWWVPLVTIYGFRVRSHYQGVTDLMEGAYSHDIISGMFYTLTVE